jgi:hypothetical protein
VVKDRAAPFSRKHRRIWIPVTGGMVLIGLINVGIGWWSYVPPPPEPARIELVIPAATPRGQMREARGDAGVGEAGP